jgi:hypothetical protein
MSLETCAYLSVSGSDGWTTRGGVVLERTRRFYVIEHAAQNTGWQVAVESATERISRTHQRGGTRRQARTHTHTHTHTQPSKHLLVAATIPAFVLRTQLGKAVACCSEHQAYRDQHLVMMHYPSAVHNPSAVHCPSAIHHPSAIHRLFRVRHASSVLFRVHRASSDLFPARLGRASYGLFQVRRLVHASSGLEEHLQLHHRHAVPCRLREERGGHCSGSSRQAALKIRC